MIDYNFTIKLIEGDKLTFKQLFENQYSKLLSYVNTFTNNPTQAEDIVQQSFIKFWENRKKLNPEKNPVNYLYKIAYHLYIDSTKKFSKQREIINIIKEKALRERIHEDEELLEKRIKRLNEILDSLPPKCKRIVYLHKVNGLKYREIAEVLDISIKTVESQMRIAFQKIREGFQKSEMILILIFRKVLNWSKSLT